MPFGSCPAGRSVRGPQLRRCGATLLVAAIGASPIRASAQADTIPPSKTLTVGERLSYDVTFGPIKVGRASMEVMGVEEVRGRQAWHTRFQVTGGTLFFRVNDIVESWIDTETFSSLRFRQQLSEGSRDRLYEYEIFPESATYIEKGKPPARASVSHPLDDGSFLYFLRTVPLELGASYEFDRYFMPDRNPVRLDVLKRDTIDVPAGRFSALVIRPVIKSKGVFSKDGKAQVWISDDRDHVVLQMTSHLKIGSISLHLRSRTVKDSSDSGAATRSLEFR
jgi:hypothetical protein